MPPIWEMFERCFKFLELMAAPLLDPQAASITILWASIMMGMAMVRAADQWAAGFEDWCWELGMMWELALVHNRVDKRNRLYRINGRVGKFKIRYAQIVLLYLLVFINGTFTC